MYQIVSSMKCLTTMPDVIMLCVQRGAPTHHYYPLAEWGACRVSSFQNTQRSIKNLCPYIRCPVTLHQVTFWVWKMIANHCGGWENLAVFIIGHPVTWWFLPPPPHRWSVTGNAYETNPAYVLSSFKWCTLQPFTRITYSIQSQATTIIPFRISTIHSASSSNNKLEMLAVTLKFSHDSLHFIVDIVYSWYSFEIFKFLIPTM